MVLKYSIFCLAIILFLMSFVNAVPFTQDLSANDPTGDICYGCSSSLDIYETTGYIQELSDGTTPIVLLNVSIIAQMSETITLPPTGILLKYTSHIKRLSTETTTTARVTVNSDGSVGCSMTPSGNCNGQIQGDKVSLNYQFSLARSLLPSNFLVGYDSISKRPNENSYTVIDQVRIADDLCGNRIINTNEDCDGFNLNEETCQSQGYSSGAYSCNGYCSLSNGCYNTIPPTNGQNINIILTPVNSTIQPIVGQPYPVDVRFMNSAGNSAFSVASVLLQWDPSLMQLSQSLDFSRTNYTWMLARFDDPNCFNTNLANGDAILGLAANPSVFPVATADGMIAVTLWVTPLTNNPFSIGIARSWSDGGLPSPCPAESAVYDDEYGGWNIATGYYGITLTAQQSGPPTTVCGNSIIEENEQCDGLNIGEIRCPNLGTPRFDGGILGCNANCTFDTRNCIYGYNNYSSVLCGNNSLLHYSFGLVCQTNFNPSPDDDLLGQLAPPSFGCNVFGFTGGNLKCAQDCVHFDTSNCTSGVSPPPSGGGGGGGGGGGSSGGGATTGTPTPSRGTGTLSSGTNEETSSESAAGGETVETGGEQEELPKENIIVILIRKFIEWVKNLFSR